MLAIKLSFFFKLKIPFASFWDFNSKIPPPLLQEIRLVAYLNFP